MAMPSLCCPRGPDGIPDMLLLWIALPAYSLCEGDCSSAGGETWGHDRASACQSQKCAGHMLDSTQEPSTLIPTPSFTSGYYPCLWIRKLNRRRSDNLSNFTQGQSVKALIQTDPKPVFFHLRMSAFRAKGRHVHNRAMM